MLRGFGTGPLPAGHPSRWRARSPSVSSVWSWNSTCRVGNGRSIPFSRSLSLIAATTPLCTASRLDRAESVHHRARMLTLKSPSSETRTSGEGSVDNHRIGENMSIACIPWILGTETQACPATPGQAPLIPLRHDSIPASGILSASPNRRAYVGRGSSYDSASIISFRRPRLRFIAWRIDLRRPRRCKIRRRNPRGSYSHTRVRPVPPPDD